MTELLLNPNLQIRSLRGAEGRVTAYRLIAPIKGRGRLSRTVEIGGLSTEVVDVLQGLVEADADIAVGEAEIALLVEFGVLIHEHEVSKPVMFACRLDDHRVPVATPLTVNHDLEITTLAALTGGDQSLALVFEPCEQVVLVGDPVTGARLPYWIDDQERLLVQSLVPGAPAPAELDSISVGRLARAEILIDEQVVAARLRQIRAAAVEFANHRYAELPQLLPPSQLAALRRYYLDLITEGHVASHDNQVALRFARHNERLMQYYHQQLHGVFARVAGQPIKPSYSYFSSYRRGATLPKHTDRPQCMLTASLLLEYVARPSDDQVWPLCIELPTTGEQISICLEPGSGVLYGGCELPHYRDTLHGERSTSFFLHYVDETFAGSLQ